MRWFASDEHLPAGNSSIIGPGGSTVGLHPCASHLHVEFIDNRFHQIVSIIAKAGFSMAGGAESSFGMVLARGLSPPRSCPRLVLSFFR